MKFAGKVLSKPEPSTCYIPRGEDEVIRFRAQAVLDYSKFEELVPDPVPPNRMYPGGRVVPDFEDKAYRTKLHGKAELKMAYMIINSLKATEELEWEQVEDLNPDTWTKWKDELIESGFNNAEINLIIDTVYNANSLNSEKFEEAKRSFTRSQVNQV